MNKLEGFQLCMLLAALCRRPAEVGRQYHSPARRAVMQHDVVFVRDGEQVLVKKGDQAIGERLVKNAAGQPAAVRSFLRMDHTSAQSQSQARAGSA
jgi:hypothetical protein